MMTPAKQYVDEFWGPDIVSTAGYDAICKRSKVGRATCKDIADFLTQRAKLEVEYSRGLQRLAKSFTRTDLGESHTLTQGWFQLVNQVEKTSEIHEDASNLYKSESDRLLAYMEEQKAESRKAQENVKKSQTNKITSYGKTVSLQKVYYTRCREANLAKQTYEGAKMSVSSQQKELDKLKQKMEKCTAAIDQADQNYNNSVAQLTTCHNQWERDMEDMCQVFQELEESRLDMLRRKMWTFANVGSKVALGIDNCFESLRETLQLCDVANDVDEFIHRFNTGSERPARVEYINFYSMGDKGDKPRPSLDSGFKITLSATSSLSSASDAGEYMYATVE